MTCAFPSFSKLRETRVELERGRKPGANTKASGEDVTAPARAPARASPAARRPPGARDTAKMADGGDGGRPQQEPGPEPGEEFEIVDRSQVPGPGELRRAAKSRAATEAWSAPILTLARRATGTLSAGCGSALRAAASLGGADSGADDATRAGRLQPGPRVSFPSDRWLFCHGCQAGKTV